MFKVAVIGYGYWGPNLARVFSRLPDSELKIIVDRDAARQRLAAVDHPGVEIIAESHDVFSRVDINLVVIATPAFTHFELASRALNSGKHVWIEKPMAATQIEAQKLVDLAEARGLQIMTDHTYVYSAAVRHMKKLLDEKRLGELLYYDSQRINLGLFQPDTNVIWDLAPHDFSIIEYLFGPQKRQISAHGAAHLGQPFEDVAYLTLQYESNFIVHLQVSWMSPVKIRHAFLGGSKAMLAWDDLSPDETIKIYDTGVELNSKENIYKAMASYRKGDMFCPVLPRQEPLKEAALHFLDCLKKNCAPITDGRFGLNVVKCLEATDRSIKNNGMPVEISF